MHPTEGMRPTTGTRLSLTSLIKLFIISNVSSISFASSIGSVISSKSTFLDHKSRLSISNWLRSSLNQNHFWITQRPLTANRFILQLNPGKFSVKTVYFSLYSTLFNAVQCCSFNPQDLNFTVFKFTTRPSAGQQTPEPLSGRHSPGSHQSLWSRASAEAAIWRRIESISNRRFSDASL